MRRLMYISIGFGAACVSMAYITELWMQGLLLAAVVLIIAWLGQEDGFLRKALLILMGCAAGMFWWNRYDTAYLSTARTMDGTTQTITLQTVDFSYETDYGIAVDTKLNRNGQDYLVRAYLDGDGVLSPGMNVTGAFQFRLTTADSQEGGTYHPGKGIFLLAYQRDEVTVEAGPLSWRDYPAIIRREIKSILRECFPEDTFAFAKALLIGDTSDLDYAADTDFKLSGIRHVIAVSGLHVSILFTLISNLTFRKRWLTALVGFPMLALVAAVVGFTPSVTRACIMSALMLLAMLANREYDGHTALAFSVLVMLLGNPLVVTAVGFQLSVASVAGIYLFSPWISQWILSHFDMTKPKSLKTKAARGFATSVSITLSAMTLTTPLCAHYFGMVSLVSVITNLLTLWIISFIFYGIIAVCLLNFMLPVAAAYVAQAIAWPIRYVLIVARSMANIPLAAVYTRSVYITVWLLFVYLLLIAFLHSGNRRPVTLSCCAVTGLCIALCAGWFEPRNDDVRFTMLDVGQGQSLLLQTEGRTFLIDCGGDSAEKTADIVAETLLSQGITRLDGIILTHLDEDHAGGVSNLLSRIDTGLLILPPEYSQLPQYTKGEVVWVEEDMILELSDARFRIITPVYRGNSNENSLCILFDSTNCDILITGDRSAFGEKTLLRYGSVPDVDILVAGHHGSKNSTSEELLSAVTPEIVCISAGKDNSFGHPAPETLKRLNRFGCTVYRTDIHGTITIRR